MTRRLGIGLALAAGLSGGCGWHAGMVPPVDAPLLERADGTQVRATSVGVELFGLGSRVLERDLEPLLHAEISRAVSDFVSAPLLSPRSADLVVRGTIVEYRRRGGVRTTDHDLLETGVRITAEAELVHRASGEVLRTATSRIWSGYGIGTRVGDAGPVTTVPENERAARDRALEHVAETLVLDLFRVGGASPENSARETE